MPVKTKLGKDSKKSDNKNKKEKKSKVHAEDASLFSVIFVQLGMLALSVVSIKFEQPALGVLFFAAAVIGFVGKIWTAKSAENLYIDIQPERAGLFPGESTEIVFNIKNNKLSPVSWVEISKAVVAPYALVPSQDDSVTVTEMDESDKLFFKIDKNAEAKLFRIKCSLIGANRTMKFRTRWDANKRGFEKIGDMRFYTGDPFGLARAQVMTSSSTKKEIVVYPAIVPVTTEAFTRDMWEGEMSNRGVLEELSVIKLTRPYQSGDSQKKINWRMLARGQELTVNQYEVINPSRIHFVLDGESFNGIPAKKDELEETLSILASIALKLDAAGFNVGFSFPKTDRLPAVNIYPGRDTTGEILYRLAEYNPREPEMIREAGDIDPKPAFKVQVLLTGALAENAHELGRVYYVTYSSKSAASGKFLSRMAGAGINAAVLTYDDLKKFKVGEKEN